MRASPDAWEALGEPVGIALGALGHLGNIVLRQASGCFRHSDLLKMWPTLVFGGSQSWRVRQTRAVALFALPFFPFPETEVAAVESGFSGCPRLLAPASFLEADLWVGDPESLPSPEPCWVSR